MSESAKKAAVKAMRLIAVRERCAAELYKRLCVDFDEKAAAAAVAEMVSCGLVDDVRFAREYADYLTRKKGYAPRRVEFELRAKGVDADLAKTVAAEIADGVENYEEYRAEVLYGLVEKKYGRCFREAATAIEMQKITARAVRNFVGKGYGTGEILGVIKDITALP